MFESLLFFFTLVSIKNIFAHFHWKAQQLSFKKSVWKAANMLHNIPLSITQILQKNWPKNKKQK